MGKETSERIQTSILNGVEKKVLVWLAKRQPKWMTSDGLTYLGVVGSIIFALGGYLANLNSNFLNLNLSSNTIRPFQFSVFQTLLSTVFLR